MPRNLVLDPNILAPGQQTVDISTALDAEPNAAWFRKRKRKIPGTPFEQTDTPGGFLPESFDSNRRVHEQAADWGNRAAEAVRNRDWRGALGVAFTPPASPSAAVPAAEDLPEDDRLTQGLVSGLAENVGGLLYSPGNVAIGAGMNALGRVAHPAAKVAKAGLEAKFTADAARGVKENVEQGVEAAKTGDQAGLGRAIAGGVFNAGLAGGTAAHIGHTLNEAVAASPELQKIQQRVTELANDPSVVQPAMQLITAVAAGNGGDYQAAAAPVIARLFTWRGNPHDVIDPSFHGQGKPGAELRRKANYGPEFPPRSYAWDTPEAREAGFGPGSPREVRHTLEVPQDRLYDLAADPEGFLKSNYGDITMAEGAIKGAGYAGYFAPDAAGKPVYALFQPQEAAKIERVTSYEKPPEVIKEKEAEAPQKGSEPQEGSITLPSYASDRILEIAKQKLAEGQEVYLSYDMGGSFHEPMVDLSLGWHPKGRYPRNPGHTSLEPIQAKINEALDKYNKAYKYSRDYEGGDWEAPAAPLQETRPQPPPEIKTEAQKEAEYQAALAESKRMSDAAIAEVRARLAPPPPAPAGRFPTQEALDQYLTGEDPYAILTATREAAGPPEHPENVAANQRLVEELKAAGYKPEEMAGMYEGNPQGASYLVPGMDAETARKWGKKYGQESVIVPQGLLYSESGDLNPIDLTRTTYGPEALQKPFYSKLGETPFSMFIDFDRTIPGEKPAAEPAPEPEPAEPAATPERTPITRGLSLRWLKKPPEIEPAEGGEVTLDDIGKWINDAVLAKRGAITGRDWQARIARFEKEVEPELKHQLAQEDSGQGWYKGSIQKMRTLATQEFPELANDAKAKIFTAVIAATSPQKTPPQNLDTTYRIWDMYRKAGRLPMAQPNGLKWGIAGDERRLAVLQSIVGDMGEQRAAEWLTTKHSFDEVQKYGGDLKRYGFDPNEPVYGFYAMGPKVGAFGLNLSGIHDQLTVDTWFTRTWNRYMGTMFTREGSMKNSPTSGAERRAQQTAVARVAAKHGLDVDEVQAAMWYYEQALYRALGANSESYDYAESARKINEARQAVRSGRNASDGGANEAGGQNAQPGGVQSDHPGDKGRVRADDDLPDWVTAEEPAPQKQRRADGKRGHPAAQVARRKTA